VKDSRIAEIAVIAGIARKRKGKALLLINTDDTDWKQSALPIFNFGNFGDFGNCTNSFSQFRTKVLFQLSFHLLSVSSPAYNAA
jgi:hypothetical protein